MARTTRFGNTRDSRKAVVDALPATRLARRLEMDLTIRLRERAEARFERAEERRNTPYDWVF